ncbi:MAG: DNA internalization-related competence protein ComEC/Rec2 [Deltaproteobacteria bacterium]|nr:DNA internalization-related competence protein ComEC/Rec2 [Deltaproteobacteria bacterium]MCL5277228.1 DNA internalization-related competence protein ComEC/Rec2 [Deltaproteobacteria bacterium]
MGLLPVFVALAAGILLHDGAFFVPASVYVLSPVLLVCSCVWVRDRRVWILLASFFTFLAAGRLGYRADDCSARVLSRAHGGKISISGWVDQPVSFSPDMEKMIVKIDRLDGSVVDGNGCFLWLGLIMGQHHSWGQRPMPARGNYITAFAVPRRPKNYRNPGSFDYRKGLERKGIGAVAYVGGPDALSVDYRKTRPGPVAGMYRATEAVRNEIRRSIEAHVENPDVRGVITALVIGDQGSLSRDVRRTFSSTGIIHILVVAGLHLGIITHLLYMLLKFLLSRSKYLCLHANIPKLSLSASMIPMAGYMLVSGAHPPVVRSGIMISIYCLIFLVNRQRSRWTGILVAAILILVMEPAELYSISFQLSFISVGSLIAFMPLLTRLTSAIGLHRDAPLSRALGAIVGMLLVSFFITVGLAGVLAFYFNTVPLLGILLNVVVIPLFGYVILPLSIVSSIAGTIAHPALQWACRDLFAATSWLIRMGVMVVRHASDLPMASIRVPTPSVSELILYYSIVLVLMNVRKAGTGRTIVLASPLVLALLLDAGHDVYRTRHRNGLSVTFLDVGHGDSAFVESPHGGTMLIDGGGGFPGSRDIGESVVARYLWSLKRSSVDYVIASHPQVDHIGGLGFVVRHMHVKEVYRSDCRPDTQVYRDFMDAVGASGAAVHTITASAESVRLDGADVTLFTVPHEACGPASNGDINDYPVMVRITYGGVGFLFTGDIEKKAERLLVDTYGPHGILRASVLKAAHHGSRTSSTGRFLDAVRPEVAVISAAEDDRFHVPSKAVLRRFFERGVRVVRTDRSGAIRITTDGRHIRIEGYVEDGGW